MEVRFLPEAAGKEDFMSMARDREIGKPIVPAPVLKNKLEYLLYKRGREDGETGRPLANLSDVYLQGYILGQVKLAKARGA